MKEVRNSERFQVPKSMPDDLADYLSLLIHLHKQKVTIERLPNSNLKKYLTDRINGLLDITATQKERCEFLATSERLETIERLQFEVTELKTNLASAEDQLIKVADKTSTTIQGFGFFSLSSAFVVGYLLAWLMFGLP